MSPRWLPILCVFLLSAAPALGQEARNPLRFVPSQAELVVKVERPRELLDAVEKNELVRQALKLPGVREYYDTTTAKQLYQLIAYFEKQLGQSRDEIIDDLGAAGIVLGAKLTPPQGAVLVIQSKDEKKLRRFMDVALDILQKEFDRQEAKDALVRSKYLGYEIVKIGGKPSFAIADGALVIASEEKALKLALDTQNKKGDSILQVPSFVEAHKKASAKALGWVWLNLEEVRKNNPQFKSGLDASTMDPFQMMLFGGFANLLKRSPYLTASLAREGNDYRLGLAMPRGREGMSPLKHMMLPPEGKGMLPPLVPPRVLSSSSYYLDLGQLWDKRVEILGKKSAAGLEEGDKKIAMLLGGIKLAKLFQGAGPNHRLVFAQQKETPYKIKPATPIPAFALVIDVRDPAFVKDMNSVLRAGALLATFKIGLSLKEDTYKGCALVTYYFSETKKVEGDPQNVRFNFSPTYVAVGDQFVVSATVELARDLIDVLQSQQKPMPIQASMRTQLYASGLAQIIRSNEDATLTQLILSQALAPKTAKSEFAAIIDWIDRLGTLRLDTNYGTNDFHYDILWQAKKR